MPDKRRVLLDECVFQAPESDCFYYLGSWSLTCPLFVIQNRKAPTELIKPASDWVTKIPAHDLGKNKNTIHWIMVLKTVKLRYLLMALLIQHGITTFVNRTKLATSSLGKLDRKSKVFTELIVLLCTNQLRSQRFAVLFLVAQLIMQLCLSSNKVKMYGSR